MNKLFLLGMFVMFSCQDQAGGDEHLLVYQGGNTVSCDYTQAFGDAQHVGCASPTSATGMRLVAKIVSNAQALDQADQMGFYSFHDGAPLTSGDYVVVPSVRGFSSIFLETSLIYSVQVLRWVPSVDDPAAVLTPIWSQDSTWRPIDRITNTGLGTFTNGYVMGFYPAITGGSLYVPAASGRVTRMDLATGVVTATVDPLAGTSFSGDIRTLTVTGLTTDAIGNVWYGITAIHPSSNSNGSQPRGSWLAHVRPNNTATATPWAQIASPSVGIPGASDLCAREYGIGGSKPASSSSSPPVMFACGTQRPSFNSPIAIDPVSLNVLALTHANNAQNAAFIVEVDPSTMEPVRSMDLRGRALNGCGVRLDPTRPDCSAITDGGATHFGFDPFYNLPTPLDGFDLTDSAVAVAPNGDRVIGGYDRDFSFGGDYDSRGFMLSFARGGAFRGANLDFGWEVTPTALPHDGTFSYVQDRNLYSHVFEDGSGIALGRYSPTWAPESVSNVDIDFDAVAVDFLDANVLVDSDGGHYGVNGDGHVYHFSADGSLLETVELTEDDGSIRSVETLSGRHARDRAGRLYISFAGVVWVIAGTGDLPAQAPHLAPPSARARAGLQRKLAGIRGAVSPVPSIVQ